MNEFPNDNTSKLFATGVIFSGYLFGVSHLLYLYSKTFDSGFLLAAVFSSTLAVINSRLYPWELINKLIKAKISDDH